MIKRFSAYTIAKHPDGCLVLWEDYSRLRTAAQEAHDFMFRMVVEGLMVISAEETAAHGLLARLQALYREIGCETDARAYINTYDAGGARQ